MPTSPLRTPWKCGRFSALVACRVLPRAAVPIGHIWGVSGWSRRGEAWGPRSVLSEGVTDTPCWSGMGVVLSPQLREDKLVRGQGLVHGPPPSPPVLSNRA